MNYILILLLLYFYYIRWCNNQYKYEKLYCIILCVTFVLLAAFRSNNVGGDTASYREDYFELPYYNSIDDLIERFGLFYIGYYGLSKIFSILGMPVQVWFAFVESLYLFALMKLINIFSKDRLFSLLIFVTSGLFLFSLAGLKQTMSTSFMILAFCAFTQKKYWLTIPLIIFSFYTHQATLVFLAVYPIYLLRNTKLLLPSVFIVFVLIYFFNSLVIENMATAVEVMGNEHYQDYVGNDTSYTLTTFLFYTTITIIASLNLKKYIHVEEGYAVLFVSLSLLACALQLLAGVSPTLFRLSLIYVPFMMILLPNSVFYSSKKLKRIKSLLLISILVFFYLYTNRNIPYSFY